MTVQVKKKYTREVLHKKRSDNFANDVYVYAMICVYVLLFVLWCVTVVSLQSVVSCILCFLASCMNILAHWSNMKSE